MKKVVIILTKDGQMTMDFMGFKGRTCDIAEDRILKQLDALKISKKKEKYKYQPEKIAERVEQHA